MLTGIDDLRLYARVRRIRQVLVLYTAVGAVAAVWGAVDMAMFTSQSTLALPLRVLLPVLMASATAQTLAGDLADFEGVAARRIAVYDVFLIVSLMLVGSGVLTASMLFAGTTNALDGLVRNLVLWTGIAVVSGRLLNPKLSWVIPIAAQIPLQWWGFASDGTGEWWAISLQDSNPGNVLMSLAICAIALAWLTLTRWHWYRLRRQA